MNEDPPPHVQEAMRALKAAAETAEAERDRLRAAMEPMLGAYKGLEKFLIAVRAGEAPTEDAMAVIAGTVGMVNRAAVKHGTIERQLDGADAKEGT